MEESGNFDTKPGSCKMTQFDVEELYFSRDDLLESPNNILRNQDQAEATK